MYVSFLWHTGNRVSWKILLESEFKVLYQQASACMTMTLTPYLCLPVNQKQVFLKSLIYSSSSKYILARNQESVITTVCCCLVYQRCHLPCAPCTVSVCDRTRLVPADSQGPLTSGTDTDSALLEIVAMETHGVSQTPAHQCSGQLIVRWILMMCNGSVLGKGETQANKQNTACVSVCVCKCTLTLGLSSVMCFFSWFHPCAAWEGHGTENQTVSQVSWVFH